jgi:hypothetical protein
VTVTAGYGCGLSGFLGFLLRARHGGSRSWMADELLSAAEGAQSDQAARSAG